MLSSKKLLVLLSVALVGVLASGCGSSSDSGTTPVDTAPPAVPTNMSCQWSGDVVKVTWDANQIDADFAGFTLMRSANGATVELVTTPTDITFYADQNPVGGWATYYLSAVDRVGNESAYASTSVYAGSTVRPRPYED